MRDDRALRAHFDAQGADRGIHRSPHGDRRQDVDDVDLNAAGGSRRAGTRRDRAEGDHARALTLTHDHGGQVVADDVASHDAQAQLRASRLRQGLPGLAVEGGDRDQYGRALGDVTPAALDEGGRLRSRDFERALISIVGVAPTRPETATRSKRGSTADCGLGSAVTSVALGSAGWRAHQAMPPPAARSTRARRRRPSSEAREEPRERSPLAAARCEPFARRAREESGVCEAELMPES